MHFLFRIRRTSSSALLGTTLLALAIVSVAVGAAGSSRTLESVGTDLENGRRHSLHSPAKLASIPHAWGTSSTALTREALTPNVLRGSITKLLAIPDQRAGATAALSGSVVMGDIGVAATLTFVAGPNEGRTTRCAASGDFRCEGLFPGLSIVSIRGGGGRACERSVALRPHQGVDLVLDFAKLAMVEGRVVDEAGVAIAGALVTLDGGESLSDAEGHFVATTIASGSAALVATHPGFARSRLLIDVDRPVRRSTSLLLTLRRSCRIELRLSGELGNGDEARVLLLPESERGTGVLCSSFPWEQLDPIRMPARGIAVINDLPPGRLRAIVVNGSGMGDRRFILEPGETREVVIDMRAAPRLEGTVVAKGEHIAGARVILTSRPVKTAAIALGDARGILYTQPIADLPFARHETKTDAMGEFELPWWSTGTTGSAAQRLHVVAEDGSILHERDVARRTARLQVAW